MAMPVNADLVVTTLTIVAGLALGIERSLEVLKHLLDMANKKMQNAVPKDTLSQAQQKLKQAEEKIDNPVKASMAGVIIGQQLAQELESEASKPQEAIIADSEAPEKYLPPPIKIVPQTPLSPVTCANALFYQLAAAGMGIFLAWYFNINLLSLLMSENGVLQVGQTTSLPELAFYIFDVIFSGLVIGGGSQPIHLLIRFITERKVSVPVTEAAEEILETKPLGETLAEGGLTREKKEPRPFKWIDFAYRGGVKPESLLRAHIRPSNPNLIVYHHTAMSSSLGFQDIVDEFLVSKKWLTGYHCVIMPDGTIKPFCRWDRYGNHAKGKNSRSLGISFHGNFHTDPKDKYSNADGRYGNQQPTEAQLHAGARVVALWVALYDDINLDFDRCIKPHKEVMEPGYTVCPGSNFKYDEFKNLIQKYHDTWDSLETAQAGIEKFKKLPYIYAV